MSDIPSILGWLGPYTSASKIATFLPVKASATAKLEATVDLPTPPFPDAIAITLFTPLGLDFTLI